MRRPIPSAWQKLMDAKGLGTGRRLAAEMGVSPDAVQRLIHGGYSSEETIHGAATTLGVEPRVIYRLRGEAPREPFVLPPEASKLTRMQREAVVSVVRAMLEPGMPDEPARKPSRPSKRSRNRPPTEGVIDSQELPTRGIEAG